MEQSGVDSIIDLIRKRYPSWTEFSDPDFVQNEVTYKQRTVTKARSALSKEDLSQLIQEHKFDEFLKRVERIGWDSNLLFRSVPLQGDLNVIYQPNLNKAEYCAVFFDLLHGEGSTIDRLGRYLAYVKDNSLPNKWTFPSYFLFVCFPDDEILVKPRIVKRFLRFIGQPLDLPSSPTPTAYEAIRDLAHELRRTLKDFGPRDMVDIQGLLWVTAEVLESGGVRFWKISPGEDAWNWETCRDGNYIAIGWDDIGDISQLSRAEFDEAWEKIARDKPDWTTVGRDQAWTFAHEIKVHDRIVANRGTTEVLAIGTVSGGYRFVPNVRHGHQLPVTWDDLTRREVDEQGWRRTLVALDQQEFKAVSTAPEKKPGKGNAGEVDPACPFSPRTFELLAALHSQPTKQFYMDHKDEFRQWIEEPFQKLFFQVLSLLPSTIKDVVEIEKKLFGKFLKNDFGLGGAWDFYWGASYPKGGNRIQDSQLFLWMNHEELAFGFSIGEYGSDTSKRFLRNCREYQDTLIRSLANYLVDDRTLYGRRHDQIGGKTYSKSSEQLPSLTDWLKDPGKSGTDASVVLSTSEVLRHSSDTLSHDIAQTFQKLFPLVLLSTYDDPSKAISAYIEEGPSEEPNPEYTLAQCAQETFFDLAKLGEWVRAIERKGQAIIYGPPGTGKTYAAEHLARHLIGGGDGFVETVQLHPAVNYEDFIQGLRPVSRVDGGLDYQLVPGRFLDFSQKARVCKGRCVLIVDEINRANLSRVFGELMYLLEYREREVPLASGGVLSIPRNVRLIGTMNTADRSIALVDHALRRRFAFLALHPDYRILERYHENTDFCPNGLIATLRQVNAEIANPHYEVGISFFLRKSVKQEMEDIWRMEIEPYLEEYFFDQTDKANDFRWEKMKHQVLQ